MAAIKKTILLALTVLVITGCEERPSKPVDGVNIVTIDSCEYIINYTSYGFNVYSHKGNCHFCKERRQKELEELIIKLKGNNYDSYYYSFSNTNFKPWYYISKTR